jgi:hypothetical protein
VAADGRVGGVVDRSRAQHALGFAEQSFHSEKFAVSQHRLQWRDAGVGAQHEDTVVPGLLGQFSGVDLEGWPGPDLAALPAFWGDATQIAAVGGVADQRLVAALQLLLETGDDGLPVGAVLLSLGLVAAHNVALAM